MPLSRFEKETILLFNEDEPTAIVCTYNSRLKRKLSGIENPDCCLISDKEDYVEYRIPKGWIKINPPKQFSEEQRQKMAERMRERRLERNDIDAENVLEENANE